MINSLLVQTPSVIYGVSVLVGMAIGVLAGGIVLWKIK